MSFIEYFKTVLSICLLFDVFLRSIKNKEYVLGTSLTRKNNNYNLSILSITYILPFGNFQSVRFYFKLMITSFFFLNIYLFKLFKTYFTVFFFFVLP